MIRNSTMLQQFEKSFIKEKGALSFENSIRLFTHMWNEGIKLGVLPPKNPLEGIEVDIRIAEILNSCLKKSSPG